jgi:2-polyprenyl-6-methoxyphenol hydroxylase-like FAD-dependent oxidoreductase
MGLLSDLHRDGYNVQEVRFVDACGRRVGGFGADVFRLLTNGRYVSIPRGDLARLIYRWIEGRCETIFGDSVARIEQESDGVRVEFERAPARHFDLVIGADGLHSEVRRLALKYRLGNVETDGCDSLHDWLLRIVGPYSPHIHGTHVPVGEPSTASQADIGLQLRSNLLARKSEQTTTTLVISLDTAILDNSLPCAAKA